jgi:1L-myo-inositol 1-phosphate cytidylyltransferase
MSNVRECLILAAGNGTRMRPASGLLPKPLVEFRGKPLLEHIVMSAWRAGIKRFTIVVGYRSDLIRAWFAQHWLEGISVHFVENPDYHKQNGVSALKARGAIRGDFLLLMADHIFETRTARLLINQPLAPGDVILAVDSRIDNVFDPDDATKVRRVGTHIVDIGKEISHYDALDTGMFLCSPELFATLELVMKNGDCSLSDGMRRLAAQRRFHAFDIGNAEWQDVDTPEALAHADTMFAGAPAGLYSIAGNEATGSLCA